MPHADVIVIGAGAAGLMTAITAGRRGRNVVVLEHNDRVGKKIAISGGGRCNFTNLEAGPENYLSGNPDFCRSALARYTPWDFVSLVEKHGIAYHEKKLGQQFCNQSSRQIIEMLLAECREAGVVIECGCRVQAVEKSDRFRLETQKGPRTCDSLVVATGGLSFPKLGATDFGHRMAGQFGLRVTPLRPGLVPLVFGEIDRAAYEDLSGLALPVGAVYEGTRFNEAMLITHRGLSGPAILQISSYWKEPGTIRFDLLPEGFDWEAQARESGSIVATLARHWPRRFAEVWCERHTPAKPLNHWKKREWETVDELLRGWPLAFPGTEGYAKAEVTLGGVDTGELSSKTMESRKIPGLYFVGEVVDVTGWLGGYNFQWAWASGNAAGLVV